MKVLIVDAHSMIFAWPEYRAAHQRRRAHARAMLVHALTAYQDATGTHVIAVFDGTGDQSAPDPAPHGIQVFYSARGRTADDIVERLTARYASKHEIVVATDDRLEQETVYALGASWMTSDGLRDAMAAAGDELRSRIERHRRP